MKEIILIVKDNCIACDAVEQMLENICTNNSDFEYTVTNNNILKVNAYPTLVFVHNKREVARISGTMPIDFYKTIIDKFKKL